MKLRNKAITFSIGLISATTLFVSNSFAAKGTVTAETVRMREEPTTKASIVLNLDKDDEVDIIEESDGWYKVEFEGKSGYVSANYLDVNGDIASSTSNENTSDNNTTSKNTNTVSEETESTNINEDEKNNIDKSNNLEIEVDKEYIVNKNTSIYILPLVSSIKLNDINEKNKVIVKEVTNLWAYISCDAGNGWIIKDVLKNNENINNSEKSSDDEKMSSEKDEKNTETNTLSSENKIGYVNVDNVYVRKGPSTDSEPIGSLELNDKITILDEENNWYKIKYENGDGYIAEKLISNEKTTNTTSRGMTQARGENKVISEEKNEETNSKTTGEEIVEYAKTFLGAKYVSGGNGPSAFDCSGFTKYVYNNFGYSLSRTSSEQANNGVKIEKNELQQGDLLIFLNDAKTKIGHVGIYIGANRFIHAANATRGVVTDSVNSSYYGPRFVEARRIL